MPGSQYFLVPAGSQLVPTSITPGQSVCACPAVLGGTMLLESAPTQNGPWSAVGAGALTAAQSFRPASNQWIRATAATQNGSVSVSDIGIPSNILVSTSLVAAGVFASGSSAAEQVLYSFRIPPGFLPLNFKAEIYGNCSFVNSANA